MFLTGDWLAGNDGLPDLLEGAKLLILADGTNDVDVCRWPRPSVPISRLRSGHQWRILDLAPHGRPRLNVQFRRGIRLAVRTFRGSSHVSRN
jgi:hypothetical protein